MSFRVISDYRRRELQEESPEQEGIRDEEGMEISLDSANVDFDFNYDDYNTKESIKNTANTIGSVVSNPATQIAIFLASLNPMMFSFSANILNRLIYFRGLKTTLPTNLDSTYKLLGSTWGVKSG